MDVPMSDPTPEDEEGAVGVPDEPIDDDVEPDDDAGADDDSTELDTEV